MRHTYTSIFQRLPTWAQWLVGLLLIIGACTLVAVVIHSLLWNLEFLTQ